MRQASQAQELLRRSQLPRGDAKLVGAARQEKSAIERRGCFGDGYRSFGEGDGMRIVLTRSGGQRVLSALEEHPSVAALSGSKDPLSTRVQVRALCGAEPVIHGFAR